MLRFYRRILLRWCVVVAFAVATTEPAQAVTQSMHAAVAFVAPLKIAVQAMPSFGNIRAEQAGVYVLDTAGTVYASNGGGTLGGAASAGKVIISGATDQTVDISVGNYTASGGVVPSAATCKYGKAAAVACTDGVLDAAPAPSAGTPLLIGLRITTTAQAEGVVASPGFDVTVLYN